MDELKQHSRNVKIEVSGENDLKNRLRKMIRWVKENYTSPLFLGCIFGCILLSLGMILVVPSSRYWSLNTLGFRTRMTIRVVDLKTGASLQGVSAKIETEEQKTNKNGEAEFPKLRMGNARVTIVQEGYKVFEKDVTIGWAPLTPDPFRLEQEGLSISVVAVDWLSGLPVSNAEIGVIGSELLVITRDKGSVELPISQKQKTSKIRIKALNYETQELLIGDIKAPLVVKLLSDKRHYFVSQRSGKYDIYSSTLDGKDQKKVLEGTGSERDDLSLGVQPAGKWLAYVSTRDGQLNKDGFALSTLLLLDTSRSTNTKKADTSEKIQIVGWLDDRLIYVKIAEGASGGNPKRHRLISYSLADGSSIELASSNYFNDVAIIDGAIFYAPSNAYQENPEPYLFKIAADGQGKAIVFKNEVWNIFRSGYKQLYVSSKGEWYSVELAEGYPSTKQASYPAGNHRIFVTGKDPGLVLEAGQRDGKGVLLKLDDISNNVSHLIAAAGGLQTPIRIIDDAYVVYRVRTNTESADYILPLTTADGSTAQPFKLSDVAPIGSNDRWYYY
jgi:hypothetical protein